MSKLRIGVLSTARVAERRLVPAIQKSKNAIVTAVASRTDARARAFAERLNLPKAYDRYETLLADPEIDAVISRCQMRCIANGLSKRQSTASTCCARNRWPRMPRKPMR